MSIPYQKVDAKLTAILSARVESFVSGINQAANRLQSFGEQANNIGERISKSVTLPLSILGGASLKASADLEALKLGLQTTMGSAQAANAELVKLNEVAKMPGLGFKQVVEGSVQLQAAGFSADMARRSMIGFGNALASSGKGKAELDGINLALTQMASSPKVLQEEINQIRERLPQFTTLMLQAFGTARSEDIQKMGISGKQFVERMVVELEKLPKATVGLKAAWENSMDSLNQSSARLGDILARNFNVAGVMGSLVDMVDRLTTSFAALSPTTQTAIITVTTLVASIGPLSMAFGALTTTVIPALKAAFISLNSTMGLIGLAVAGVITVYASLKASTDGVAVATSIKNKALAEAKRQLKGTKEGTTEYADALRRLQAEYLRTKIIETEADIANPAFLDRVKAFLLGGGNMAAGVADVVVGKVTQLKELTQAYKELFNAADPKKTPNNNKTPVDPDAAKKTLQEYVKAQSEASKSVIESLTRVRDISISLIRDEKEKKIAELKAIASDRRAQVAAEVENEKLRAKEILLINEKLDRDIRDLDAKPSAIKTNGISASAPSLKIPNSLPNAEQFLKSFADFKEKLTNQAAELGNTFGTVIGDSFASFGEALAKGKNPFEAFGKSILASFGDMLAMIGRQMLKQAAALIGLAIVTGGALSPVAARTGLAGAALVAAGSAMKSIPKLAKGGEAFAPTVAIVGDNPNAGIDRELIGPTSTFRRMVREEMGGFGGVIHVVGEISNDKITLSSMRGAKERQTMRGK